MITQAQIGQIGRQSLESREQALGKSVPGFLTEPASERDQLTRWFASIYSMPFEELSDEDLTQFCRQAWEVEPIVPLALLRLQHNPFIGDYYDGNMVIALGDIPQKFWQAHPNYKSAFVEVLDRYLRLVDAAAPSDSPIEGFPAVYIDSDTRRDVARIYSNFTNGGTSPGASLLTSDATLFTPA